MQALADHLDPRHDPRRGAERAIAGDQRGVDEVLDRLFGAAREPDASTTITPTRARGG